jgi:hypothetical protein
LVVPAVKPATTPSLEPIVATAVLLLLQVPPVVAELNAFVAPVHDSREPLITDGRPFTVTILVV